jgi:hypothetical protein
MYFIIAFFLLMHILWSMFQLLLIVAYYDLSRDATLKFIKFIKALSDIDV